MSKYFFNISFILLITMPALAQVDKFAPTSIRVGGEVANFGYSLFKDDYRSWEFEADVDFHRYFLVFDWGFNEFSESFETSQTSAYGYFDYNSKGRYYRIGPDINFIKNRESQNVLAFGLRYGRAVFRENAEFSTYNAIEHLTTWPEDTLSYSENRIRGRWMEMNASLRARIYKNLYFGFTVRYKILPGGSKDGFFKTYYAPGFGRIINNNNWGLSYYVSYRFPFRKKKQFYFIEGNK